MMRYDLWVWSYRLATEAYRCDESTFNRVAGQLARQAGLRPNEKVRMKADAVAIKAKLFQRDDHIRYLRDQRDFYVRGVPYGDRANALKLYNAVKELEVFADESDRFVRWAIAAGIHPRSKCYPIWVSKRMAIKQGASQISAGL